MNEDDAFMAQIQNEYGDYDDDYMMAQAYADSESELNVDSESESENESGLSSGLSTQSSVHLTSESGSESGSNLSSGSESGSKSGSDSGSATSNETESEMNCAQTFGDDYYFDDNNFAQNDQGDMDENALAEANSETLTDFLAQIGIQDTDKLLAQLADAGLSEDQINSMAQDPATYDKLAQVADEYNYVDESTLAQSYADYDDMDDYLF